MTRPDDISTRPTRPAAQPTTPLSPPIFLSSVYECADPRQADALLSGEEPGYVYSRDGHPNSDWLAERCRELHAAERAVVTSTGMSALAAAVLSQLESGDHIVVSDRLYGRSLALLRTETARLGIQHTCVDTCDLDATRAACRAETRLIVVETITNPILRVSDLPGLAKIAGEAGARLLVDNTFASPAICRPLEFGADLVMESLTKIMNGHSDVVLGLLCGKAAHWDRVGNVISTWGLTAPPFECWLAERGLKTLALRAERANDNALRAAEFLQTESARCGISALHYPGLPTHPDHALAARQLGGRYGAMVTFTLAGGLPAAEAFIKNARQIPFCPSLGELSTTLSHPASTSHRSLSEAQCAALGITGGTIRLSIGTESAEFILAALTEGLAAR